MLTVPDTIMHFQARNFSIPFQLWKVLEENLELSQKYKILDITNLYSLLTIGEPFLFASFKVRSDDTA